MLSVWEGTGKPDVLQGFRFYTIHSQDVTLTRDRSSPPLIYIDTLLRKDFHN